MKRIEKLKEEKKEIVVANRRKGKSYYVHTQAVVTLLSDKDVLICTDNDNILTISKQTLERILAEMKIEYKFLKSSNQFIFENDHVIQLKVGKDVRGFSNYYKIYDELLIDMDAFDLISITGTSRELPAYKGL